MQKSALNRKTAALGRRHLYLVTAVLEQFGCLSRRHTVLDVLLQSHRVNVLQGHHFLQYKIHLYAFFLFNLEKKYIMYKLM